MNGTYSLVDAGSSWAQLFDGPTDVAVDEAAGDEGDVDVVPLIDFATEVGVLDSSELGTEVTAAPGNGAGDGVGAGVEVGVGSDGVGARGT